MQCLKVPGLAEHSVEKVSFCDKNLSPCTGCLGCQNKDLETHCVIKDDMPYIYKRFLGV